MTKECPTGEDVYLSAVDVARIVMTRGILFVTLALIPACRSSSNPASDDAGSDAAIACTSPLRDAGFSSLAVLPLAAICQGDPAYHHVVESSCGSWTLVSAGEADCNTFFLFDATTGALVALSNNWCEDEALTCTAAAPGFQFPSESDCPPPSQSIPLNLCTLTDAGSDAQYP